MSCRSTTCCRAARNASSRARRVEAAARGQQVRVSASVAGHQVVEEDAFLQRGQRVDVGDVAGAAVDPGRDRVDLRLGQLDQRQHGGVIARRVVRDRARRHRPRRRRPAATASPAGVGDWNSARTGTAMPRSRSRSHQRHGQQRVAAEREEVVVGADLVQAEDLGERRRRGSPRAAWPGPAAAVGRPRSRGRAAPARSTFPLAVSGSAAEHDDGRRDHVARAAGAPAKSRTAAAVSVAARRRVAGDDVADQPPVAGRVLADDDDGLARPPGGRPARPPPRRARPGSRGS